MAESTISPAELFGDVKPTKIKQLEKKPNDTFLVLSASSYSKEIIKRLSKTKLHVGYRTYLRDLVEHMSGKMSAQRLMGSYQSNKDKVDIKEVQKYFGEIVGPLYAKKKTKDKIKSVVFPQRSNYELFDFFLQTEEGIFHGYSSKIQGGTSNTLSPKEVFARINKLKTIKPEDKLAASIISTFTNESTLSGIVLAAGMLVKNKKISSKVGSDLLKDLNAIKFNSDAMVIETGKATPISRMRLSNKEAHIKFMNKYILPRLKNMTDAEKKLYAEGKKEYNGTNLAYGYGLLIVDANAEDKFDISNLIKTCFQDMNIVKLGIKNGVPVVTQKNISPKMKDKYYLRSKHRFSKIKDKLGIQL